MSGTKDGHVETTREGAVTVLALDHQHRRNAITPELGLALDQALRAADDDPGCRVIVLTGKGTVFCGGADLATFDAGKQAVQDSIRALGARPLLAPTLRKPVLAAVNGAAVGLGLVYALAADVSLAADSATFVSAFAQLGLVAEYGIAWFLQRQVGLARATEILLTGRAVDARDALAIGLVHRVLPAEELMSATLALAQELAAACSPTAMATIKQQLRADASGTSEVAVRDALDLVVDALENGELWEALVARRAGRPPLFAALASQNAPVIDSAPMTHSTPMNRGETS